MSKWTRFRTNTAVRVGASAGTLIAVAAVVGAGWKWG